MEAAVMHGVVETVPPFGYNTYEGSRRVYKTYDGHERIVAAFLSPHDAKAFANAKRTEAGERSRGGHMVIHEFEHRLIVEAKYNVVPVDVMPSVPEREPV